MSPAETQHPPGLARRADGRLERWGCSFCGYVYDGEQGEAHTHTPAGTPFEVLSPGWRCPHCGALPEDFFL